MTQAVVLAEAGVQGSAKAWVQFVGATATISSSYNVSSVTRNGAGDYTVNFTNAMANANYGTAFGRTADFAFASNDVGLYPSGTFTTSAFRMVTGNPISLADSPRITAVVFSS